MCDVSQAQRSPWLGLAPWGGQGVPGGVGLSPSPGPVIITGLFKASLQHFGAAPSTSYFLFFFPLFVFLLRLKVIKK